MSQGIVVSILDTRATNVPGYLGQLDLTPANGYAVQSIDIGFPEMRAVVENVTDANGTTDSTQYYGARPFTMAIGVAPELVAWAPDETLPFTLPVLLPGSGLPTSPSSNLSLVDALRAYMRPGMRPVIRFKLAGSDELRQVSVRADQSSFIDQYVNDEFMVITCGWRVPSGVIESATAYSLSAFPATKPNRSYSWSHPRVYPAAGNLRSVAADNAGTEYVDPLVRFFGPLTGPAITHLSAGKTLRLTRNGGVSLVDGEYVDVDFRSRTVVKSDGTNLYNRLDTPAQWWQLVPGNNDVSFSADTWTGAAHAEVIYRSAWI